MSDPVQVFLSNYPEEIQAICRELRLMLNRAMPGVHEFLFYNTISYGISASADGRVCYISPSPKHVTLGFRFGAQLQDRYSRLQGKTRRARHVRVGSVEDARGPALKDLVKAAWAAGPGSIARMNLERSQAKRKEAKSSKTKRAGRHRRTRGTPRSRR